MNYKKIRRVGINIPPDGLTIEEELLAELLANNTIESLYAKLPTARMKFIVASHFELGYPQTLVSKMLNITQPALNDEINLIQRVLTGKPYAPRKKKQVVKLEDVMKMIMYVSAA